MSQVHELKNTLRQPGLTECFSISFGYERALRRRFKHHTIDRHDCRDYKIAGAQVRIVPGHESENYTYRLVPDESAKVVLWLNLMIVELFFGDVNHVKGPLLKAVPNLDRAVTN